MRLSIIQSVDKINANSILLALILCSSLVYWESLVDGIITTKEIWIDFVGILILLKLIFNSIKPNKTIIYLIHFDLLLLIFISYKLASSYYRETLNIENLSLNIVLFVIFLFGKSYNSIRTVLSILSVLTIQIIIGLAQIFNIVPTYYKYYPTGFLWNPNIYGIYLSLLASFSISIFLWGAKSKLDSKIESLAFINYIGALYVLVYTNCRSAWLALVIITAALFFLTKRDAITKKINIYKLSFLIIPILILLYFLYEYKSQSSEGRIYIWKITYRMIQKNFWLGVGPDSFQSNFIKYQADYFSSNQFLSKEIQFAGDVKNAFNDLLQLIAEGGLISFLIISFSIIALYKTMIKNFKHSFNRYEKAFSIGILASLLCLVICSFFSYCKDISIFSAYFCFCLGFLSKKKQSLFKFILPNKALTLLLVVCLFFISFNAYTKFNFLEQWNKTRLIPDQQSHLKYESYKHLLLKYPNSKTYPTFLLEYAKENIKFNKYSEALNHLELAKKTSSNPEIYYYMSECLMRLNNYRQAENTLVMIDQAMPGLIKPKYLLAKLYLETNEIEKFKSTANRLIKFTPKVESDYTDSIKNKIQQILNQQL